MLHAHAGMMPAAAGPAPAAAAAPVEEEKTEFDVKLTGFDAAAKIKAAYSAGCRRFDSALAGLGGCPFAQDALVGNIPTELLLGTLQGLGATTTELMPLDELIDASRKIASRYGPLAQ